MQRARVTPEEFVKIWQQAETLDEVVEKTGLSRQGAIRRGTAYRARSVRLKKFSRTRKFDWLALQRAAHKYRK